MISFSLREKVRMRGYKSMGGLLYLPPLPNPPPEGGVAKVPFQYGEASRIDGI